MSETSKVDHHALLERCALLEEKNSELIARIRILSEENRANDSLLRVLLENTPFGIVIFDEKRRVVQVNKAAERHLDMSRVNVIGASCDKIFNCYIQNSHSCPILDENKTLDRVETNCKTELCSCESFLLRSVVAISDNNEKVLVEAFIDITPIKQAQLEIENANLTKDNFLSKISHELRTPLNVILGFTELLQDALSHEVDHEHQLYLNNIHHASKRLLRMVEEILDITRITARRLKLDEYPVDIPELLKRVLQDVEEQSHDNENQLYVDCAKDIQYLLTDAGRLHQVLFHLLDNACKFTRQGEIHVNVNRGRLADDSCITFTVRDTGTGMSEEQQARIFASFEQADTGNTRRYNGAGLGLTLCREISVLMGGELKLISQPGEGSEFILSVPEKQIDA